MDQLIFLGQEINGKIIEREEINHKKRKIVLSSDFAD